MNSNLPDKSQPPGSNDIEARRSPWSSLKLRGILLYADVILLIFYLAFRKEATTLLVNVFDLAFGWTNFSSYRFLAWGFVLFFTCAACSYFREDFFTKRPSTAKGIVIFELMILIAVVLSVGKSVSQPLTVNPYWLLDLSLLSYVFEVVTTAGAGYVLADFLNRLRILTVKT